MNPIPVLSAVRDGTAHFRCADGSTAVCRPGDMVAGRRLEAVCAGPEGPLAVLGSATDEESRLLFLGAGGVVADLSWGVGRLQVLAGDPPPPAFPAGYFEEVLSAHDDLLAARALAPDGEVDVGRLRSLLPPLVDYTFLCDRRLAEKPIVEPNGTVCGYFEAGRAYEPGDADVAWRWALVGGSLPAVVTAFWDRRAGAGREQVAFVRPGEDGRPEVWIRLRDAGGRCAFLRSHGEPRPATAEAFYGALLALHREQEALLAPAAQIRIPDREVTAGARASLLRGFHTFVGLHPKYGVREYAKECHDTFPPAVLSLAGCALEWGLFDEGKALLGHWLRSFVREDGSFDYYGPALSEYGQMLALVTRCLHLTGDREWFDAHAEIAGHIAGRILRLRAESRSAHPPTSPLHGLIPANPEADYTGMDLPQQAYYSGDAWAWRGLKQFAGALAGCRPQSAASDLSDAADAYREDIQASIERSLQRDCEPAFLPVIAGETGRYGTFTESTPASYANYRFYPELLSAGVLSLEQAEGVLGYRWTHGGDLLATTRIWDCLDDWPVANYAWGLLAAGRSDKIQMLLYAHLFHHHAAGTHTAFEAVRIAPGEEPVRRHRTDHCVCAQVIVPTVLKWMLAWEPWDEDVLCLNWATPRAWQAAGFEAEGLPTRWGRVGLRIREGEGSARATVRLERPVPCVRLRLHPPAGPRLRAVTVDGRPCEGWDPATGTVTMADPPLAFEVRTALTPGPSPAAGEGSLGRR